MKEARVRTCGGHIPIAVAALVWSSAVAAQCDPTFVAGHGFPGAGARVQAACTWDPDGVGPAAPQLVFGGAFTVAGTALAARIVSFEPVTGAWTPLGSGPGGDVVAVAAGANGELAAAWLPPGASVQSRVSAWNGTTWTQLGGDFDHEVRCLLRLPNGELLAGGAFTTIGAVAVPRLARWNGFVWLPFAGGTDGPVRSLHLRPGGDLLVGGTFGNAGGVPANCVARWDGNAWSTLGTGISPAGFDGAYAMATAASGDLIVGGFFPAVGGVLARNIARWDGANWHALGTGVANNPQFTPPVRSLVALSNGDVVVGGVFSSAGGVSARSVARWNGAAWSALGPGFTNGSLISFPSVNALFEGNGGDLIAAGAFPSNNGQIGENISRWNGATWSSLAGGFNGAVRALSEGPSGELVAGGSFTVAGGLQANRVARWDGASWQPLGSGVDNNVFAIAHLPGGGVVIGGAFSVAGGVAASRIARWSGGAWMPLGSGTNSGVTALAVLPNGDLVAGGAFSTAGGVPVACLARWDGAAWSALGGGVAGLNATVTALHVRPDGTLIVGGRFTTAGGVAVTNMAAWDGTTWTPLGSAAPLPSAITTALGGAIVATDSSFVRQWDGAAWTTLGLGATSSMFGVAGLPDGDVLAVGAFDLVGPPHTQTLGIARWGASGWSPVDGGLRDGLARVVLVLANGDIVLGGEFQGVGNVQSPWFARIVPPCRAGVAALGAGCSGASGSGELEVTERAWLGGAFRARSVGMPAVTIVVGVTGFGIASIPLAAALPAPAGCVLHVQPDVLDARLAVAGSAEVALVIPDLPALLGQSFHHQHVPFAFDPVTGLNVGATAAVTATIGLL